LSENGLRRILQVYRMAELTIQQVYDLALQHHESGRLREAEQLYRQVLAERPEHPEAVHHLGVIALQEGRNDIAVDLIRRAVVLKPDYAEAHGNLGSALAGKGQLDDAIASYRRALASNPKMAKVHFNLGNAPRDKGHIDDAVASYRQAIALWPDYAEAYNNLGNVMKDKGQLDDAIAAYRRATALNPGYAEAHNNLGNVLKEQGLLDDAIAAYRQAMSVRTNYVQAHSNLIYLLHFHPAYDARMIYEEHRRWNHRHAEPLKKLIRPHTNNRDPDRQLRIGYVSPDFREHSVGRFILPLLAAQDSERFTVFCYSDARRSDALTANLRRHANQWRNTVGLTDERAARLIREDQIDILVDLTMHMADNRMLMFASKPAPVQVTYLAYCSTTGLDTFDYRFTDPLLDPPGSQDGFYSEKSVGLPDTYWCYAADERSPEVNSLPALASGEVTFGCLNNFSKVSPDVLDVWMQLLRSLPNSRLILHAHEGSHRQRVRDLLQHQGIDPRRLKFAGKVSLPEYFALHRQIDIGLDPFPYNGGTTTCDALWMGVPVVTLTGRTAVGRGGASVLRNVGLPELVAETPQQYVEIALALAADLPRVAELRRTLRARMQASPLMDAPRFAQNVEAAYREMWRNWCAAEPRS
jgi:predicted O-linked N-acetylglucosamine transferase (SPINDLY family)